MIVLPGIPITPQRLAAPSDAVPLQTTVFTPQTLALRAALSPQPPANHAELAQYLVRLEEYLESGFTDLVHKTGSAGMAEVAARASATRVSVEVPWTGVVAPKQARLARFSRPAVDWPLSAELAATTLAIAGVYIRMGAELLGELLDTPPPPREIIVKREKNVKSEKCENDEKWRQVAEHYKRALSVLAFGSQFQFQTAAAAAAATAAHTSAPLSFHPSLFSMLEKICHIGIQMSILCKSSWANRGAFLSSDTFASSNNGVLCRVAIWVFNEVAACQNLLRELEMGASEKNTLALAYEKWHAYLAVFFKYVTAYSGLFLAIEYYQQAKLGQAIGLLNFALVTLQRKNLGAAGGGGGAGAGKSLGLDRLKNKLAGRKNDTFIANLQSVTSLDIDKSVFSESSGAMLSDLSSLFDQLVMLHLKFSKENDNLRFEPVSDWKDTRADSKWPLGAQIPVSPARAYLPRAMAGPEQERADQARTSYY